MVLINPLNWKPSPSWTGLYNQYIYIYISIWFNEIEDSSFITLWANCCGFSIGVPTVIPADSDVDFAAQNPLLNHGWLSYCYHHMTIHWERPAVQTHWYCSSWVNLLLLMVESCETSPIFACVIPARADHRWDFGSGAGALCAALRLGPAVKLCFQDVELCW